MRTLVTGAAGFIGFHLCRRLLADGHEVVGVDNLSDYYPVALKRARLAELRAPGFRFEQVELADRDAVAALFAAEGFEQVVHLAAQAGVRYSLEQPHAYVDSNVVGLLNVLEGCRHHPVRHLVYASSSSVYGDDSEAPFRTSEPADRPVSLYAATKRSGELMAHAYAHLYGIPTTGLRFFTVYGEWGRPDMAVFKFTDAIEAGRPIDVYGGGEMARDFTYVGDVIEGVVRVLAHVPAGAPPVGLYNIGRGQPIPLLRFIEALETALGKRAQRRLLPMQPGDVRTTWADTSALEQAVGYAPRTSVEEGLACFVRWYRERWLPMRIR